MTTRETQAPYDAPSPSLLRDLTLENLGNAAIAFVFAASGPVAIILSVGIKGGLSEADLASWLFGAFFLNGIITIAFCAWYRQPLVFLWTIPGAVLMGPALQSMSFAEAIGAYIGAGLLMLALGLTGLVRRVMDAVPLPIVMGMVAGVFLQFGLDWIFAFEADLLLTGAMTATFVLLSRLPSVARAIPPLLVALVVGVGVAAAQGTFSPQIDADRLLATPQLYTPEFSLRAALELVVPLTITVLVVQNGQGIAVLTATGHRPPTNAIASACGVGTLMSAFVGAICTCLTGPVNAILAAGSRRESQYAAGIVVGLLAMAFGLFSPLFTSLLLAAPGAFIATLAGLAMLKVLQSAFTVAFRERFTLGALIAFLVTVSEVSILNIGAPFWGLVFGVVASLLLERADFAASRAPAEAGK